MLNDRTTQASRKKLKFAGNKLANVLVTDRRKNLYNKQKHDLTCRF
ncbi:hypothetical protein BDFB_005951 [Asbolus verrucosus]|uniref:Uncharacterized protein n=1 Tax=Asbolus verrucosus TaxID=1661398 RepID=A0A482VW25_ASBVE|nr:hypothetical protein BDFB_005951 [Asbolus verrucosus]